MQLPRAASLWRATPPMAGLVPSNECSGNLLDALVTSLLCMLQMYSRWIVPAG